MTLTGGDPLKAKLTENSVVFHAVQFHKIFQTGNKQLELVFHGILSDQFFCHLKRHTVTKVAKIEKIDALNLTFLCFESLSGQIQCSVILHTIVSCLACTEVIKWGTILSFVI